MKVTASPTSGTVGATVKEEVGPGSAWTTMLLLVLLLAPFESVAVTVTV